MHEGTASTKGLSYVMTAGSARQVILRGAGPRDPSTRRQRSERHDRNTATRESELRRVEQSREQISASLAGTERFVAAAQLLQVSELLEVGVELASAPGCQPAVRCLMLPESARTVI